MTPTEELRVKLAAMTDDELEARIRLCIRRYNGIIAGWRFGQPKEPAYHWAMEADHGLNLMRDRDRAMRIIAEFEWI